MGRRQGETLDKPPVHGRATMERQATLRTHVHNVESDTGRRLKLHTEGAKQGIKPATFLL